MTLRFRSAHVPRRGARRSLRITRQPSRRTSGRVESSGERRAAGARLAPQTRGGNEATRDGMVRSLVTDRITKRSKSVGTP